jgi:hypothetical protein
MKTVWKVLAGLALVVPMGAYVVGSLAASAADDPAPRQTIQIREPAPTPTPTPRPTPTSSPSPTRTPQPEESGDVEVITPHYDDFDDDDDRGDDDGDDHSGHGGGDD